MTIRTLIEMLAFRAETTPERLAFSFELNAYTFGQLWAWINQTAQVLHTLGIRHHDHVVIAIPNSPAFFPAFYGVQRCGGVAVPVFPKFSPAHILHFATLSDAKAIMIADEMANRFEGIQTKLPVLTVPPFQTDPSPLSAFHDVNPEDIAFIQYTSGSTGNPKGVQLSHQNLIDNAWQLIEGMGITENERFVSWLPLYHDMGLILMTVVPFLLGAKTFLLPSSLTDPTPWLATIQRERGTFTAAPDFAYRLCLRYLQNPTEYDLTSLRVALNAAEPVRLQTIHDFEKTFGLQNVMTAGYGLAEATVGVSMSRPNKPIISDERGLVSVGKPFRDVSIKIDADQTGNIGEILINSRANSQGYYKNSEATAELFREDGYFHSGDLGYTDTDGNLYIVGRLKNTIIHMGRTIAPQEIEEQVDRHPQVRFSAAVGIDRGRLEGEQIVVFAEVRGDTLDAETLDNIIIDMVDQIHQHLGFRPARVLLLKRHAIPLTHNGKIQHAKLRELYLTNALQEQGFILFP